MKFSKLTAIIAAGIMAFGAFSMPASAEIEKITFGDMETVTADGTTTVTVTADKVLSEREVSLIAAYFDEKGKILSIGSSETGLVNDGDTLTVTLADKSATGELRYFLWDSVAGQIPLRNGAPASPEMVEVTDTTRESATLSWSAADDDYKSVEKYNVYDEGILVAEGVTGTEATVDGLRWGTDYNFDVISIDDEGLESKKSTSVNFKTDTIITAVTEGENIVLSDGMNFGGQIGNDYWLGTYLITSGGGLPCIANTKRVYNNSPAYLCFSFTADELERMKNERDFIVEITYFDDNTNYIMFDYKHFKSDGTTENAGRVKGPQKTATNTWKVARIKMKANGRITASTSPNDGAYTFRLYENSDGGSANQIGNVDGVDMGLRIHNFSAMALSDYNPKNAYFEAYKANITCGMNTDAQLLESEMVDGKYAIKTDLFNAEITDTAVSGASDVKVELNYFAPEEGTQINIDGEIIDAVAGKWQKVVFTPQSASQFMLDSSKEIYIHSVFVDAE